MSDLRQVAYTYFKSSTTYKYGNLNRTLHFLIKYNINFLDQTDKPKVGKDLNYDSTLMIFFVRADFQYLIINKTLNK